MNTAIILLGSNVTNRAEILTDVMALLEDHLIKATAPYSDPDDNNESAPYLNIVAEIRTPLDFESLRRHFKHIERQFGRIPGLRDEASVALDIDIVVFNNEIMRPDDFKRPYFTHGYDKLRS